MSGLLVFTGAGVSQERGIPTFVELGDVRDKLSRSFFRKHPQELYEVLSGFRTAISNAEPNTAHQAIADSGVRVITMNIDGMHQRAGSSEVIEIHGGMEWVDCPECNAEYPFGTTEKDVFSPCCRKVLEPRVVLYEDSLPLLEDALRWVDEASELLVVGTSFYTSTASYVVDHALRNHIPVTVINESAGVKVPEFIEIYRRERG